MDEVSYKTIRRIESEILANLVNTCIDTNDIPTTWIYTTLVALMKPGRECGQL